MVGIADVARHAGVSIATVSRALRGLPNVSEATRERVERSADELGYAPDPNAARLASGRTTMLGIVVPSLDSWFFAKVAAGAEAVFSEHGRDVTLFVVPPGEDVDAFFGRRDLAKRVSGLLLVNLPMGPRARASLEQLPFPAVAVGAASGIPSAVCVDELDLARQAVEHLVELGHERIGLVGDLEGDQESYRIPRWRRDVWAEVLAESGLDHGDDLFAQGAFTIAGGHQAGRDLLARPNPPTAVFAMSDELAVGVMWAARDLGLDVPEDLSIVGVDDHDVAAAVGLTTVHQDPREQGRLAAELLLEKLSLNGDDIGWRKSGDVSVSARLIVRLTSRTPSTRRARVQQRSN